MTTAGTKTSKKPSSRPTATVSRFISKYAKDILILWYLVIFTILLIKFWDYWSTLLK